MLNGKRVLVTGAAGFIGSHLVDSLLEQGAQVTALVHYNSANHWGHLENYKKEKPENLRVILGDINDLYFMINLTKGTEVVFHLAALIAIPYSYQAPGMFTLTNVQGTMNVMQASLINEVSRVVHTSTSEVYGTAKSVPINEEHPIQAQSPYAASKYGADKIVESYHLSYGLPVITVRPFNTYGPRQSERAVIPTIISQALKRDEIKIGNVETKRDFTFVKDTVSLFICAAVSQKGLGDVFNGGTKEEHSIKDVIEIVGDILGKKLTFEKQTHRLRPPKSEVMRLLADNSKAKDVIGWQPSYTFKEGIGQTVEWIKKNLDQYDTERYVI